MTPELLKKEIETLLENLKGLSGHPQVLDDSNVQDVQILKKKVQELSEKLSILEFVLLHQPIQPKTQIIENTPKEQATPRVNVPPVKKGAGDLKGMIGLNDRYRFVNELFGGNSDEFNAALNQLNLIESEDEAEDYLDRLSGVYNWNKTDPTFEDFHGIVKQKLS